MKRAVLVLFATLIVSCTSTDSEAIQRAAREGVLPNAFPSYEAAVDYCSALFAGGRAEALQIGSASYLVVIQHGSGRPVLGIALYQEKFGRWQRIAAERPPVSDFVHASVSDGSIVLTEEGSRKVWTFYVPKG